MCYMYVDGHDCVCSHAYGGQRLTLGVLTLITEAGLLAERVLVLCLVWLVSLP